MNLMVKEMRFETRASTKDLFFGTIRESVEKEDAIHSNFLSNKANSLYSCPALDIRTVPSSDYSLKHHDNNISTFSGWFKDGSTFYTVSEDIGIRIYITSQTLLEDNDELLVPFIRKFANFPISGFDIHPDSSLYDGFCASLIGSNDTPLHFRSLIPNENGRYQVLNSFKTQNNLTEKFPRITSLKFLNDSTFIAGSNSSLIVYNINQCNALGEIVTKMGTTSYILPSKSEFQSNLSFYCSSFNNKVQLYSSDYELISSQELSEGNGVTQLIESDNGKYLYVIKRNSTEIDVLDLRMNLSKVGELTGFCSSNQRIKGDILPRSQGLLIGSSNGVVYWYKDAEMGMSSNQNSLQISESSVSSITINPLDPSITLLSTGDRSFEKPQIQINQLFE